LPQAEAAVLSVSELTPPPRFWLFSSKARVNYLDVNFRLGDALVFGKESVGLARELLDERVDCVIGIPMPGAVRSLNLANAVAIVLYEALRQTGVLHLNHSR
jgi:tRNA (cytidine/uridine-2'-O-)-methyltransferase